MAGINDREAARRCSHGLSIADIAYRSVRDPVLVIKVYEEFRSGRSELPLKFFWGTEGLCRAVVIVLHVCDVLEIDVGDINEDIAVGMGLDPIIRKYGNIDTMLALFDEMVG